MEMDGEILMFFIFQSKGLGNHAVVPRLEALLKMSMFYALILGGDPFLSRHSSLSLARTVRSFNRDNISQQNFRSLQLCEDSVLVPVFANRKGFVK